MEGILSIKTCDRHDPYDLVPSHRWLDNSQYSVHLIVLSESSSLYIGQVGECKNILMANVNYRMILIKGSSMMVARNNRLESGF